MRHWHILWLLLFVGASCEQQPYQIGQRLYQVHCANCHMDNGAGLGALIPPLADSDYLRLQRDKLPCLIRHGLQDTILVNGKIYAEQMPGNKHLNEVQIANVLNYVLQSWGNQEAPFSLEEVNKALNQCQPE
jgi:mono/diheme cytochrome c family protein